MLLATSICIASCSDSTQKPQTNNPSSKAKKVACFCGGITLGAASAALARLAYIMGNDCHNRRSQFAASSNIAQAGMTLACVAGSLTCALPAIKLLAASEEVGRIGGGLAFGATSVVVAVATAVSGYECYQTGKNREFKACFKEFKVTLAGLAGTLGLAVKCIEYLKSSNPQKLESLNDKDGESVKKA